MPAREVARGLCERVIRTAIANCHRRNTAPLHHPSSGAPHEHLAYLQQQLATARALLALYAERPTGGAHVTLSIHVSPSPVSAAQPLPQQPAENDEDEVTPFTWTRIGRPSVVVRGTPEDEDAVCSVEDMESFHFGANTDGQSSGPSKYSEDDSSESGASPRSEGRPDSGMGAAGTRYIRPSPPQTEAASYRYSRTLSTSVNPPESRPPSARPMSSRDLSFAGPLVEEEIAAGMGNVGIGINARFGAQGSSQWNVISGSSLVVPGCATNPTPAERAALDLAQRKGRRRSRSTPEHRIILDASRKRDVRMTTDPMELLASCDSALHSPPVSIRHIKSLRPHSCGSSPASTPPAAAASPPFPSSQSSPLAPATSPSPTDDLGLVSVPSFLQRQTQRSHRPPSPPSGALSATDHSGSGLGPVSRGRQRGHIQFADGQPPMNSPLTTQHESRRRSLSASAAEKLRPLALGGNLKSSFLQTGSEEFVPGDLTRHATAPSTRVGTPLGRPPSLDPADETLWPKKSGLGSLKPLPKMGGLLNSHSFAPSTHLAPILNSRPPSAHLSV
eukprot:TRINITY_DN12398_c0_g1_i1.p1 TRINITY_DN12398_c0_g1~~TRINITY_DN12398_c0_g1_i1.p1  ORF type:complete len:560 (-),score=47.19 TRINITY_DN12398_c0_g1_i1:104-1783(-)